jgi:hypothetical protein
MATMRFALLYAFNFSCNVAPLKSSSSSSRWKVDDALNVRKTFAVSPFISEFRCLFSAVVWSLSANAEHRTACGRPYRQAVKDVVIGVLVVFEDANVLEDLGIDLDAVIVPNGVFTQKVKDDEIWSLKSDVFAAQ